MISILVCEGAGVVLCFELSAAVGELARRGQREGEVLYYQFKVIGYVLSFSVFVLVSSYSMLELILMLVKVPGVLWCYLRSH